MLALSIVVFLIVLAIPALPAIFELRKPRDAERLGVYEAYKREPRYFGQSFRRKLAPAIARVAGGLTASVPVALADIASVEVMPALDLEAHAKRNGVVVAERVTLGEGAAVGDCFARNSLVTGPEVRARTLASDGTLVLGDRSSVERWLDADGDIVIGDGCSLGQSASTDGALSLGAGSHFERVWGRPVRTNGAALAVVTDAGTRIEGDLVKSGNLVVQPGMEVTGTVKAGGDIRLEPGVRVGGNVIARGRIVAGGPCEVAGNVFAEGPIELGCGTIVGRADSFKTVYSARRITLGPGVTVHGWIISEEPGVTA